MVCPLGMYFAAGQNMLTKYSLNVGVYFFLCNKISRVSLLVVLVYLLKTQLGSFFLSVLSSQNVGFHFHACLMVTKCLLQIQPLGLHGRQNEAVKNRTCLICPLLQIKLSMVLFFSAKFWSDLTGSTLVTGLPLKALNSICISWTRRFVALNQTVLLLRQNRDWFHWKNR